MVRKINIYSNNKDFEEEKENKLIKELATKDSEIINTFFNVSIDLGVKSFSNTLNMFKHCLLNREVLNEETISKEFNSYRCILKNLIDSKYKKYVDNKK